MHYSNIYSKEAVRTVQRQGKVCVLDIEIEGVKQIRDSDLNPLLVFIMPPSIAELERRLKGRKTETPESLEKRLTTAQKEIEYGKLLIKAYLLSDQSINFFRKRINRSCHYVRGLER